MLRFAVQDLDLYIARQMSSYAQSLNILKILGYTDIHKVRSMALEALQEVATPTDEYFPEADRDEADRMIIDNQLNELRSLFDDNE